MQWAFSCFVSSKKGRYTLVPCFKRECHGPFHVLSLLKKEGTFVPFFVRFRKAKMKERPLAVPFSNRQKIGRLNACLPSMLPVLRSRVNYSMGSTFQNCRDSIGRK